MTGIIASITECPAEQQDPQRLALRRKVLVVLGAAVGLTCGIGTVFLGLVGICLKPMTVSLNWSRADVTLLPMLIYAGIALGGPCLGYIADRIGWKNTIAASIVLFCCGLLAVSVAPANYLYVIAVGLLTGMLGAATGPVGYIPVVALVFDRRLGTAMGFAMLGIGAGAVGIPILANKLLEVMDWRQLFACFSGISLLTGFAGHQLIFRALEIDRGETKSHSARPSGNSGKIIATEGLSLRQAVRSYRFWLIGVVAAVVYGTTIGGLVHLAAYATDRGIAASTAAQAVGLVGLGVGVARFGVAIILDRIFAPLIACSVFLLSAAGFYLLTADIVLSAWVLPLAAVLIGLSTGAEGDLVPFLAKRYFGVRSFGAILGILYGFASLGGAVGQYTFALVFDRFGSYTLIHQASAIGCCLCGFSVLMLGRYRYASGRQQHTG